MITTRDLLLFMLEGTIAILAVTAIGYYYFTRWSKREKEIGRRHIDAHIAEIMRDKSKD
jgi:hypothetical protein